MTRWRQRIGEDGMERLLQATITAGKATRTITESSLDRNIMDTTVQPKAVEHPTDARQYRKVHRAMLKIADHPQSATPAAFRRRTRIGHLKADGLLERNFRKGMKGDAINAVLCGSGHNLRKILARIRLLCLDIWRLRTFTRVVQTLTAAIMRLVWPWPLLPLQVA